MRDAAGQLADGLHALGVKQLFFKVLAFGDVRVGGDETAPGHGIAANFDDRSVGALAFEDMGFEAFCQFDPFPDLGLDVAHDLTRKADIGLEDLDDQFVALAGLVAVEVWVYIHGYFGIDGLFAFNAWFGFASCVAMIFISNGLGKLLKREDTYYDLD